MRKIVHIDMDAFYASVEQRDDPSLAGKPVAVGGSSNRGVVAAASYEARQFGVFSAMPSKIAARKCPGLIFVKPRFEAYKEVSLQIRDIFYEYTDLVEPLSLDEAYLDVTSNKKGMPSATLIAKEIKARIKASTQLTASAGISVNKFLAKTATDIDKPDGLTLIAPDEAVGFVEKLPIEKFFGIGKVTAAKMRQLGIKDGMGLKAWPEEALVSRFGKVGRYYYKIARAIDERAVNPNRIRKSIGAENTFNKDLSGEEEALEALMGIAKVLAGRLHRAQAKGKTLTIKVKNADFTQITRSKTLDDWIDNESKILDAMQLIFATVAWEGMQIRLLGLAISNLYEPHPGQAQQLTIDF